MKRFIITLLAAALLIAPASAAAPDLSGMSFDDLVALRDQLNLAIWNSAEWQEVTVPAGVWTIGEDIPAGHWTVHPQPGDYVLVTYCDSLDQFGTDVAPGWQGWSGCLTGRDNDITSNEPHEVSLVMEPGMYFINRHTVTFTPYAGKPDLGFH